MTCTVQLLFVTLLNLEVPEIITSMHSSRMRTARRLTVSGRMVCLLMVGGRGLPSEREVCFCRKGDGSACPMTLWEGRPPSTNTCENITFPQLRWWAVIMFGTFNFNIEHSISYEYLMSTFFKALRLIPLRYDTLKETFKKK